MSRLALPLASAFAFAACAPLTFSTEVKGEAVVLGNAMPVALNVFPSLGGMSDLDFNANREFLNAAVTRDNVSAVVVESVNVKILSPSDQDFTFLDTLQLVARASDKEVLFAEKLNVKDVDLKAPNPTLALDIQLVDLAPYVSAPIMSIVMRGKGRQPLNDTRLEVKVKLRVSAAGTRK